MPDDLPEIGRAGERVPAGALVEDLLGLGDVHVHRERAVVRHAARAVRVVEDERGVDRPRARRAGQAGHGREAHRRVERLARFDGAHGRAGAKVHHDEVRFRGVLRAGMGCWVSLAAGWKR